MDIKQFCIDNWKWLLLAAAILIGISVVFDLTGLLFGAGASAVAWFGAKQVRRVQQTAKDVSQGIESISTDIQEEIARQEAADISLEEKSKAASSAVVDVWDNSAALPTPGLDDE
jgi:hypothetical protein